MKILLIVLLILCVASAAIIFFLSRVLKNTYKELIKMVIEDELNFDLDSAYDGKYYPCTLFLDVTRGSPHERIYDFSLYESHNVIGVKLVIDEDDEELYGTKIIPRAIVYQAMEGCWMWKPSS